jgi:hypothetical protein
VSVGLQEVFNEVHGDRVPQVLWDGELLEEFIGFVTGGLGMLACGTVVAEFLYEGLKVGPDVFLLDYCKGFVLTSVPREDVIMFVLENSESEIVHIWDVNLIMVVE